MKEIKFQDTAKKIEEKEMTEMTAVMEQEEKLVETTPSEEKREQTIPSYIKMFTQCLARGKMVILIMNTTKTRPR